MLWGVVECFHNRKQRKEDLLDVTVPNNRLNVVTLIQKARCVTV
jgi:hypothetical protein